jgi:hypothetical protein
MNTFKSFAIRSPVLPAFAATAPSSAQRAGSASLTCDRAAQCVR